MIEIGIVMSSEEVIPLTIGPTAEFLACISPSDLADIL
jgi:hypothetical protein